MLPLVTSSPNGNYGIKGKVYVHDLFLTYANISCYSVVLASLRRIRGECEAFDFSLVIWLSY